MTRRSNTVTEKMVMVTTEIYRNVSLAVLYIGKTVKQDETDQKTCSKLVTKQGETE